VRLRTTGCRREPARRRHVAPSLPMQISDCARHCASPAFGKNRAPHRARPHYRIGLPAAPKRTSATATFRVLAKGDLDADAALASAVGCPPPPSSLTPLRRPLSFQRGVLREGAALPTLSDSGRVEP
jgi:hypothetical protein